MRCNAVFDTNVLVAALLSPCEDSATVQLVKSMFFGEIVPVYSREIMDEYKNVLYREKFKFDPLKISYILSWIENVGIMTVSFNSGIVLPDPKDLPFYEAICGNRENQIYLVTGNLKHFPKDQYIISAREMLDILRRKFTDH